ncbi:MAG TPA: hypothetical protein VMV69_11570 [Pirellulales bacterium]|nr:hypothetical protein [Pirellulales bacterium]
MLAASRQTARCGAAIFPPDMTKSSPSVPHAPRLSSGKGTVLPVFSEAALESVHVNGPRRALNRGGPWTGSASDLLYARVWIQRTIGLADAARIERAVRAVASHMTFTDVLGAVASARYQRGAPDEPHAPDPVRAPPLRDREEPNYWSVVFDVVTPAARERLVEAATCQARG